MVTPIRIPSFPRLIVTSKRSRDISFSSLRTSWKMKRTWLPLSLSSHGSLSCEMFVERSFRVFVYLCVFSNLEYKQYFHPLTRNCWFWIDSYADLSHVIIGKKLILSHLRFILQKVSIYTQHLAWLTDTKKINSFGWESTSISILSSFVSPHLITQQFWNTLYMICR